MWTRVVRALLSPAQKSTNAAHSGRGAGAAIAVFSPSRHEAGAIEGEGCGVWIVVAFWGLGGEQIRQVRLSE